MKMRIFYFALLISFQAALLADPFPSSATFFGGLPADVIYGVTTDATGAVYVVGNAGTDLPHGQSIHPSGYEMFVAKFSADGRTLIYSTLIGGVNGRGIAVDAQGSAYIVGLAGNGDLPMASTAQPVFGGGVDAAILKLSPDGSSVVYATFLGGSGDEIAKSIAVDDTGSAYIAGNTTSLDFPFTPGAAQTTRGNRASAFVAKLNPAGTAFVFASFLGGTNYNAANGVAVDNQHRVYVTGQTQSPRFISGPEPHLFGPADVEDLAPQGNAFVARLDSAGAQVDFLSLIRGSATENGVAVAVDGAGRAVVLGTTSSSDFPATTGAAMTTFHGWQDLFVARLTPAGDGFEFATYLGTGSLEGFSGDYYTRELAYGSVALDADGGIYLAANTYGTWSNVRAKPPGNDNPGSFVAKLRANGDGLEWLHYLGGRDSTPVFGLARTSQGSVWAVGYTTRPYTIPTFPTTETAFQTGFGGGGSDGFLVRLSEPAGIPVNNTFGGRLTVVRSPGSFPFTTASAPPDENKRSLWWSWASPSDGFLTVRVDSTVTNDFTAALAIYTGTALDTLVLVTANGSGASRTNLVRFPVQAGQTYQIALGTVGGETAEGLLSLEFSAPSNDDFAARATIPSQMPVTVAGSNANATTELAESSLTTYPGVVGYGHSVWWEWVSPTNATVSVTIAGSNFDALVQAYSGAALESLQGITSVPLDQITFDADVGSRYFFAVFGSYDATGRIQLNIAKATPPANDRFENASELTPNAPPVSVSNRNATPDPGEPALFDSAIKGFHSLWWRWTPSTRGYAVASVDNGQFSPGIGVYTGPSIDQLSPVTKSIQSQNYGAVRTINFPVAQGVTYYFLVNDNGASPGSVVNVGLQFAPFLILTDSISVSASGVVSFAVAGEAGVAYQIEVSNDLKTWLPAVGGSFNGPDFTFTEPVSAAPHFYKISPIL